jgi:hypothetical protein
VDDFAPAQTSTIGMELSAVTTRASSTSPCSVNNAATQKRPGSVMNGKKAFEIYTIHCMTY